MVMQVEDQARKVVGLLMEVVDPAVQVHFQPQIFSPKRLCLIILQMGLFFQYHQEWPLTIDLHTYTHLIPTMMLFVEPVRPARAVTKVHLTTIG